MLDFLVFLFSRLLCWFRLWKFFFAKCVPIGRVCPHWAPYPIFLIFWFIDLHYFDLSCQLQHMFSLPFYFLLGNIYSLLFCLLIYFDLSRQFHDMFSNQFYFLLCNVQYIPHVCLLIYITFI